jgi:hypothetical protein
MDSRARGIIDDAQHRAEAAPYPPEEMLFANLYAEAEA